MGFDHSLVGKTFDPVAFSYDWKQAALYALGCGATPAELDLLLEGRGPKVLPTFAVVISFEALHGALARLGGNMLTLVHGAQRCVLHRPIPAAGTLHTSARISGLYDKGKNALAFYETRTVDAAGELICETEWQIMYRGEGGFGGERGPEPAKYEPPTDRAPDHVTEMPTAATQALLYRLGSNDLNPIHSDPAVAKAAGFPAPILHGLCTFGHAGRAALGLADGDAHRITSIEGRFSKPVFPGDTIVTELWKMAPGEAYYVTKVKERAEAVITLGRVTYR